MTQKRPRRRVGLRELRQLDQIFQLHTPELTTGKRISTRLRFKDKLKAFSHQNHHHQNPLRNPSSCCDRINNLAPDSVDRRDPADKILFLSILGLSPTTTTVMSADAQRESMEEATVKDHETTSNLTFDRFDDDAPESVAQYLPKHEDNKKLGEEDEELFTDSDLELVFCPLDIPEMYEEITKKTYLPKSTISNDHHHIMDVPNKPTKNGNTILADGNELLVNCENETADSLNNNFVASLLLPPKNFTRGPRLRRQLSCVSNNNNRDCSLPAVENLSEKYFQKIHHNIPATTDYLQEIKSRLCLLGTDVQFCV